MPESMTPLVAVGVIGALFILLLSLLTNNYSLNNIKSKTVGDGQYGTARWATDQEIRKAYVTVPFDVAAWRAGKKRPTVQGLVLGSVQRGKRLEALVDRDDVHCLMIGASGVGKTAFFLYPNIEFACACGMSFLILDTKGDLARNCGRIAQKYYGYRVSVVDLRNPIRSDGNNLMTLVNRYMDVAREHPDNLAARANAEKYAKILAKTIVNPGGDEQDRGQNSYFYDAAEGVLATVIMTLSEFIPPDSAGHDKRHIMSVFKLVKELMAPMGKKNGFQVLIDSLPDTHKAGWMATAATSSSEQGMASVMSTVLSRLNSFIDSEQEQVLCYDSPIDAEHFASEKCAIFLIIPEEDPTKHFMAGLMIQNLSRELFSIADANEGKLKKRVVFYCDEFGTMPPFDVLPLFSAGRSRKVTLVPIIQSLAQLEKNYGKEGAEIIADNCQDTIFGGFAPNSQTAETLSKALGSRTVLTGSISKGKDSNSQSLQMAERALLSPDELKSLPKGEFVVMKTGTHPMRTKLQLYFKWGIKFEEPYDVITKSVRAVNESVQPIDVQSILSSTTYLFDKNYEFVHLTGAWARERHIQKQLLMNGTMQIDSKRVASGHIHSPFLALARPWATENQGEVYGYSFVYSGNFIMQAETNQQNLVRVNIGINPFGFHWLLTPGEVFQAPEVVMTFSNSGFGTMSRRFHRIYRQRLCRGKYRDSERPVLINNWEATYYDFDEEKILNIAKKAHDVGVELLVLDDGWYGKRDTGDSSLGDWRPYPKKLPNGIDGLADKIAEMGMRFGLWFEPEMVSENSDLFRAHPDWYIGIPGRPKTPARGPGQLVLDLTRPEVCDYIVEALSAVLRSAKISYVKWDMNRNITEIGSATLPANRQQELPHRYMLGLYSILERLVTAFPDVLFEGCAGGGGRFDAGMLYYFPQYWTSDDTDAIERLYIQHGTSLVMPACTMGAHVSAVPNHQVHRTTPLQTRGHIAMAGQFGYEMDLGKLSEEETELVRQQIRQYKEIRSTIHFGDLYRLRSPFEGENTAWEYVSADLKQVVLIYCTIRAHVITGMTQIRFEGLKENAQYRNTETGEIYDGDFLMNVGLYLSDSKDYATKLMTFELC